MFFAPALRKDAVSVPNRNASDFGLERFMRDAFGGLMSALYTLRKDGKSWTLQVDVPGVPRDKLRVQIDGSTLVVDTEGESPRQLRASFELPSGIDAYRTEAHLQDGVLTLKLAKAESATARRIEVQ